MNLIKDQQCIQLDMSPLALSIKQHAKQWIECYGSTLRESAKTELLGLDSLFKVSQRSHRGTIYVGFLSIVLLY